MDWLRQLEIEEAQFGGFVFQLIFLGILFRVSAYAIIFARVKHVFGKGPGAA